MEPRLYQMRLRFIWLDIVQNGKLYKKPPEKGHTVRPSAIRWNA